MLCWNPINLLDGEVYWFLSLLATLVIAFLATHGWRWICAQLHQQFTAKNFYIKDAAITAAQSPITFYIWFLSIIKCFDFISDRYFSEGLSRELRLFFGVSGVLTIGWFFIRLKRNVNAVLLAKSQMKEISLEPGKIQGITKLISVFVVIIMAMLMMEVTGVSVNTLIAFGSISGLGIAFASQEIIANFFSGVMVHIIEPFVVGDLIRLPSVSIEGHVEEVGWYETRLRSLDKQPIYIPNSFFSKGYVVNGSRRTHRKLEEKVSIRHKDILKAPNIVTDIQNYLFALSSIDTTQKLIVNIGAIGAYSVDITVVALSTCVDEAKFLALRDLVLVKSAEIITSYGAEIATPVEVVIPMN